MNERTIPFETMNEQAITLPQRSITIIVWGGTVREVIKNLAFDIPIRVINYDVRGFDPADCDLDENGDRCIISDW